MANDVEKDTPDTASENVEVRASLDKEKANKIPGVNEEQKAFFLQFANKDEEWRAHYDKKVLRKVDLRLMPILVVMYLLNFLDRANLAQARQGSLEEDLGMTGTDFNLATSIFFVGYLLMQLPSNMILTRVRPSLYLSGAVCLWGVVSTCNGATQKFSDLIVTRFFLGIVEAPFFPGAIFLMSSWYSRAELTRRIAYFYSGVSLANMFGGLIAAGVLNNLDGAQGIAGWRWLFIIEGVITIGVAIISVFLLPDYPATTRWLTEEERAFAAWRLLADISEEDERYAATVWEGLKLAAKDYRLYIFILFQHLSILTQTFQYFFPSIVDTLGYGPIQTLLLTVPVWFCTFLVSVLVTFTAAKTKDRSLHIAGLLIISAIGNAIATGSTATGARFFAMFLMPMGSFAAYTIIVAWVANSFPRPLVKRTVAIAVCNMIGNTSSIYGSYMYDASTAPQYIPGGSVNAVICLVVSAIAIVLRFVHKKENKKLERLEAEVAGDGVGAESTGGTRVAPGFRYVY